MDNQPGWIFLFYWWLRCGLLSTVLEMVSVVLQVIESQIVLPDFTGLALPYQSTCSIFQRCWSLSGGYLGQMSSEGGWLPSFCSCSLWLFRWVWFCLLAYIYCRFFSYSEVLLGCILFSCLFFRSVRVGKPRSGGLSLPRLSGSWEFWRYAWRYWGKM